MTIRLDPRRLGAWAVALAMVGGSGCSSDSDPGGGNTPPPRVFIVEGGLFAKFTTLIGNTAALVGRHAVLPGVIDPASTAVSCPGQSDAAVVISPAYVLEGDGRTGFTRSEVYDACTLVTGRIDVAGSVANGDGATMTLTQTDYREGNNAAGSSEILYNGAVEVRTRAGAVVYVEDQAVLASVREDDGQVSEVNVESATGRFTVTFEPDAVVFNGAATYSVEGYPEVLASFEDLAFPTAADGCAGPVAGRVRVALEPLEKAELVYDGCDDARVLNLDRSSGEVLRELSLDVTTAAGIFATSITDIRAFAGAPLNAEPVATAPWTGELAPGAAGERWCRGFDPARAPALLVQDVSVPRAAGASGVAECLQFTPAATDETSAERGLIVSVLAFGADASDATTTLIVGSDTAGVPVPVSFERALPSFDDEAMTLVPALGATLVSTVDTDTLADLEEQLLAAAAGTRLPPYASAVTTVPLPATPLWNCRDGDTADGADDAATCAAADSVYDVVFSRLGMWLVNSSGTAGLYQRIAAGD